MSRIVAVHGIGQQFLGAETLHSAWLPALRDGLQRAGTDCPDPGALACAFYGDLFRPSGSKAAGIPPYMVRDLDEAWEQDLLLQWWEEAARVDRGVSGPAANTKRSPELVQRALRGLSTSAFFAGIAERALIFDLKQVHAYLHAANYRDEIQARVAASVKPDTQVLVGHSLGAVVAYEALCAHPVWPVHTLVTLGAPLGIRNLIFDQLRPAPVDGRGAWPGQVARWTNIVDGGDIVALVKQLRPLFGDPLEDEVVHNGATAHAVRNYLTTAEAGRAIAAGLQAE